MLFNEILFGLLGHYGSYVIPKFITVEIPMTPLNIRSYLSQEGISLNEAGAPVNSDLFTRRVAISFDISQELKIPQNERTVLVSLLLQILEEIVHIGFLYSRLNLFIEKYSLTHLNSLSPFDMSSSDLNASSINRELMKELNSWTLHEVLSATAMKMYNKTKKEDNTLMLISNASNDKDKGLYLTSFCDGLKSILSHYASLIATFETNINDLTLLSIHQSVYPYSQLFNYMLCICEHIIPPFIPLSTHTYTSSYYNSIIASSQPTTSRDIDLSNSVFSLGRGLGTSLRSYYQHNHLTLWQTEVARKVAMVHNRTLNNYTDVIGAGFGVTKLHNANISVSGVGHVYPFALLWGRPLRGGQIITLLHHMAQNGSSLLSSLCYALKNRVTKVLLHQVWVWCAHGIHEDPYQEFFIASKVLMRNKAMDKSTAVSISSASRPIVLGQNSVSTTITMTSQLSQRTVGDNSEHRHNEDNYVIKPSLLPSDVNVNTATSIYNIGLLNVVLTKQSSIYNDKAMDKSGVIDDESTPSSVSSLTKCFQGLSISIEKFTLILQSLRAVCDGERTNNAQNQLNMMKLTDILIRYMPINENNNSVQYNNIGYNMNNNYLLNDFSSLYQLNNVFNDNNININGNNDNYSLSELPQVLQDHLSLKTDQPVTEANITTLVFPLSCNALHIPLINANTFIPTTLSSSVNDLFQYISYSTWKTLINVNGHDLYSHLLNFKQLYLCSNQGLWSNMINSCNDILANNNVYNLSYYNSTNNQLSPQMQRLVRKVTLTWRSSVTEWNNDSEYLTMIYNNNKTLRHAHNKSSESVLNNVQTSLSQQPCYIKFTADNTKYLHNNISISSSFSTDNVNNNNNNNNIMLMCGNSSLLSDCEYYDIMIPALYQQQTQQKHINYNAYELDIFKVIANNYNRQASNHVSVKTHLSENSDDEDIMHISFDQNKSKADGAISSLHPNTYSLKHTPLIISNQLVSYHNQYYLVALLKSLAGSLSSSISLSSIYLSKPLTQFTAELPLSFPKHTTKIRLNTSLTQQLPEDSVRLVTYGNTISENIQYLEKKSKRNAISNIPVCALNTSHKDNIGLITNSQILSLSHGFSLSVNAMFTSQLSTPALIYDHSSVYRDFTMNGVFSSDYIINNALDSSGNMDVNSETVKSVSSPNSLAIGDIDITYQLNQAVLLSAPAVSSLLQGYAIIIQSTQIHPSVKRSNAALIPGLLPPLSTLVNPLPDSLKHNNPNSNMLLGSLLLPNMNQQLPISALHIDDDVSSSSLSSSSTSSLISVEVLTGPASTPFPAHCKMYLISIYMQKPVVNDDFLNIDDNNNHDNNTHPAVKQCLGYIVVICDPISVWEHDKSQQDKQIKSSPSDDVDDPSFAFKYGRVITAYSHTPSLPEHARVQPLSTMAAKSLVRALCPCTTAICGVNMSCDDVVSKVNRGVNNYHNSTVNGDDMIVAGQVNHTSVGESLLLTQYAQYSTEPHYTFTDEEYDHAQHQKTSRNSGSGDNSDYDTKGVGGQLNVEISPSVDFYMPNYHPVLEGLSTGIDYQSRSNYAQYNDCVANTEVVSVNIAIPGHPLVNLIKIPLSSTSDVDFLPKIPVLASLFPLNKAYFSMCSVNSVGIQENRNHSFYQQCKTNPALLLEQVKYLDTASMLIDAQNAVLRACLSQYNDLVATIQSGSTDDYQKLVQMHPLVKVHHNPPYNAPSSSDSVSSSTSVVVRPHASLPSLLCASLVALAQAQANSLASVSVVVNEWTWRELTPATESLSCSIQRQYIHEITHNNPNNRNNSMVRMLKEKLSAPLPLHDDSLWCKIYFKYPVNSITSKFLSYGIETNYNTIMKLLLHVNRCYQILCEVKFNPKNMSRPLSMKIMSLLHICRHFINAFYNYIHADVINLAFKSMISELNTLGEKGCSLNMIVATHHDMVLDIMKGAMLTNRDLHHSLLSILDGCMSFCHDLVKTPVIAHQYIDTYDVYIRTHVNRLVFHINQRIQVFSYDKLSIKLSQLRVRLDFNGFFTKQVDLMSGFTHPQSQRNHDDGHDYD